MRSFWRRGWMLGLILALVALSGCGGGNPTTGATSARPEGMTAKKLAALPDDQLEEAVLAFAEDIVGNMPDIDSKRLSALPEGARAVFATTQLEGEVGNGGYNQYFWNTDGRLVQDALDGYVLMKMPKHAASVRKAIAIWKSEQAAQKPQRKDSLQSFSDSYSNTKLGALDELFYNLDEDPELLRQKFIRASPEKCVPAG